MKHNLLWNRKLLSNGLRVLLLPRPSANSVQLSVATEYGSNHDSDQKAGTAHYLEHMLAGGSAFRINLSRRIEELGGLIDFYTDYEYTMSSVDVLPEQLKEASSVLSEISFGSSFEEKKLSLERKIILNELCEISDDPCIKVEELLLKNLFKNHPVRRPIGGLPKTVSKLSLKELTEAHHRYYTPQNMILVLTGAFSSRDVETCIQDFGCKDIQRTIPEKTRLNEETKPKKQIIRRKAGISQTYLSIGTRTVPSRHPDVPKIDLINTIIGAGASSRLFIELRENEGLTYDIHSSHECGLDFGYFIVSCAVKEKNLPKAEELTTRELSRLNTEKVTNAELAKCKKMIMGGILRGFDSPGDCADILANAEVQFKNEKAVMDYIGRMETVTPDDLLEASNKYFQEDDFSMAIVAPKA